LKDKVKDRINPDEGEGIEEKTPCKENDITVSLRQIEHEFQFVHE
jgi:hypothetical protein